MYKNGFIKLALVAPKLRVGDVKYNLENIISEIKKCDKAEIVLLPEMCITSNNCKDLFFQNYLYEENLKAIEQIRDLGLKQIIVINSFIRIDNNLVKASFVLKDGNILGIVPSSYSDEYFGGVLTEQDEVEVLGELVPFGQIVFASSDEKVSFVVSDSFGLNDLSIDSDASLVLCSNYLASFAKGNEYLKTITKAKSMLSKSAYIVCSSSSSETSSEELPISLMLAYANDEVLLEDEELTLDSKIRFVDVDVEKIDYQKRCACIDNVREFVTYFDLEESSDFDFENPIDTTPFLHLEDKDYKQIITTQALSLLKRLDYIGIKKTVLGVSGGLDSTLALLCLAYAYDLEGMDRKNILGFTLPTKNTSSQTKDSAWKLMEGLGITAREINIGEDVNRQMELIGHSVQDVTYENIQARFRTYTLMNMANKEGAIVVGTSDMSEVALGWSTFNGDQMAMYGVNAGLPKTLIREVVRYYKKVYPNLSEVLDQVVNTPISPELSKNQKTEDIIGKYEINDYILYNILNNGYNYEKLEFMIQKAFGISSEGAKKYVANFNRRFHHQQFKRLTMPEGVKLLKFSLSPRSGTFVIGDVYEK